MSSRRLVAIAVIVGGVSMPWAVLVGPDVLAQTAPYWAPVANTPPTQSPTHNVNTRRVQRV